MNVIDMKKVITIIKVVIDQEKVGKLCNSQTDTLIGVKRHTRKIENETVPTCTGVPTPSSLEMWDMSRNRRKC